MIVLQRCTACGSFQYPPRELCRHCLRATLVEADAPGMGTVVSIAVLHSSFEEAFGSRLPIAVASVLLDCGPVVIAFAGDDIDRLGLAVEVTQSGDEGRALFHASRV